MLGDEGFSGTPKNPAVKVTGDLYRFRKNQLGLLRRQQLPTMAFCGSNPLHDVSGPVSQIDGSEKSRFTYCVAEKDGECQPNSQVGDAYVNCPYVSRPYCEYSGVGTTKMRICGNCLGDNGAYTQAGDSGGSGYARAKWIDRQNSDVRTLPLPFYRSILECQDDAGWQMAYDPGSLAEWQTRGGPGRADPAVPSRPQARPK